jgi:hypothetical protein
VSVYPTAYCEACGTLAPCAMITLHQNVGVLIVRFPRMISGHLCKRCIDDNFWRMSVISFFFGWWGIISFFYTLFTLPMNVVAWLGTWSMPTIDDAIDESPHAAMGAGPEAPQKSGAGLDLLAIAGMVAGVGGVLTACFIGLIAMVMIFAPVEPQDPKSGVICLTTSCVMCGLPGLLGIAGGGYRLYTRQKQKA